MRRAHQQRRLRPVVDRGWPLGGCVTAAAGLAWTVGRLGERPIVGAVIAGLLLTLASVLSRSAAVILFLGVGGLFCAAVAAGGPGLTSYGSGVLLAVGSISLVYGWESVRGQGET